MLAHTESGDRGQLDVAPPTESDRPIPRKSNDNHPRPPKPVRMVDDLVMALRFFSRLPTGDGEHEKPNLNRIARILPFASLVIGLAPVAVLALCGWLALPGLFAAAFAVALWVLVTGAMAEDGLADAADGLFGGTTRERRLEILKDSRHGTYGVAALCLLLVMRVAALGTLVTIHPLKAAAIWLAAMILARSGALWLTVSLPNARADGASAVAGRVGKTAFAIGMAFALALGFVFLAPAAGLLAFLVAVILAIGVALGWSALCRRLLGGQTGDLIGALQALIEVAVFLAVLVFV